MGVTKIEQSVIVHASPEKVYEAFMDAKIHGKFTGSKAICDARVGGKFTAWDGYIFGKNLELEKGKRIVQEWKTTDWAEGYGASRLELTFEMVKEGTKIVMVQLDVPEEMKDELAEGWHEFYWKPLKQHFRTK
jgi:activator of HSP90 ATPase